MPDLFTYRLTIAYDGTEYGGWQIQPNAVTIQGKIQDALEILLKEQICVIASGRTDAGVHALGQVAHFHWKENLDTKKILSSLNGILPQDIRIKTLEHTSFKFHARYSAEKKIYHYHLHLDAVRDPFSRHYSAHIRYPLDLSLLEKACPLFIGTHDFSSFANEGNSAVNPIKTLYALKYFKEGNNIRLEFEGNGFLYKMVRNIVGTLLSVASSKVSIDSIVDLFAQKNRRLASPPAPPQGLFLVSVQYPKQFEEV
jgi:tRNA pseudouridine38-40 synthase